MEDYSNDLLLIRVTAWNDPADTDDCNNWGFETHVVGGVNSITEAIKKAKKDLQAYAEDWYDGEKNKEEKVKEYISQDIWEPNLEEQERMRHETCICRYKKETVYNARYFNDETGSTTIHEYIVFSL